MTALHWPSVLEINYKRVLVVVVVVQRHVPCEQNDMGFQCSRKALLALTHTAEQLTLSLVSRCKRANS